MIQSWFQGSNAPTRSKTLRFSQLRLEALETRQALSATPNDFGDTPLDDAAGMYAAALTESTAQDASPLADTSSLLADGDAIVVVRDGLAVQAIPSDPMNDVERGDALRAVLAQALPGDEVLLGAYVFDMGGTEHIEFPAHVTVTGAGKQLTRISSGVPQGLDGAATFTLNDQTIVQDCWLEGTLYNGAYQTLVGMAAIPDNDITTYLKRVKITGDSDGIFIWTNQFHTYRLYAYDCEISTRYDAVAVLGSSFNPQYVELWNCTLTVQQPDAIPAHISNAVNISTGQVRLINCTLNATGDAESVQTAGIFAWNLGTVEVLNCTFNVTDPTGTAFDFWMVGDAQITVSGGEGSGSAGAYTSNTDGEVYVTAPHATVVNRAVFYNNSTFDGRDPDAGVSDAAAIAIDKMALFPGQTGTFANYTSYTRGINGVIIDLLGPHGAISADDFVFQVNISPQPDVWLDAPAPVSVTILGGEGEGNAERIEIIWTDGAIRNTWLQVTMLANEATGLAMPDVFMFGNLLGETGSVTNLVALTNAQDAIAIWNQIQAVVPITSPYDFNRDGQVTSADARIPRIFAGYLWLVGGSSSDEQKATNDMSSVMIVTSPASSLSIEQPEGALTTRGTSAASAAISETRCAPPLLLTAPAGNRPRPTTPQIRAVQDAALLDDAWREGP